MGSDRGLFDEQRGGDLPVGQSARDQGQDLALALGEAGEPGLAGQVRHGLACHAVDDPPGDRGREQAVAVGDRVDGGDEVLGTGPLEQEPRRAGPQCAEDVVVLFERGQDQHLRLGDGAHELAGRRDAVEVGHPHVHEHDVGRRPPG